MPQNAYLAVFEPVNIVFGTNSIPYPIENMASNTMVAFSNFEHDVASVFFRKC
jgi:hypothetical protein